MHGYFNILDLSEHECREVVDRLHLLKWLESFAVGDAAIDGQHHRFFSLASSIPQLIKDGADIGVVRVAVQALLTDARGHFVDEEALLARIGFPGLARHRVAHQDLIYGFDELAKVMEGMDDVHVLGVAAHRVVMALLEHMLSEDMLYKSHLLRSRGL